jgi:asparagine synthetase B (glutamine-hydrolysing)
LFSGGLDCTVLARLLDDIVAEGQSVDLINVAFENPRIRAQRPDAALDDLYEICPDRVTGRKSFAELVKVCPRRRWRFVAVSS